MIDSVVQLNGKKGYEFASAMLKKILQSLSCIYPLEARICTGDMDDPNYLAVKVRRHCIWKIVVSF